MGVADDRLYGSAVLAIGLLVFTYYTAWVIVMPFVDRGHFMHAFFPPREYAIAIPAALLILSITFVGTFISLVMIQSKPQPPLRSGL